MRPGELLSPSDIGELARRHNLQPTKALGQNFVIDQNTIRRIVRLAEISSTDRIVEVGAGVGTLTLALAAAAAHVSAVEIDLRLIPALTEVLAGLDNVQVVRADAMKLDYSAMVASGVHRLVSNLPYNIATPLIATLLEEVPGITDFVIMVQKEAAQRFVATPGSRTYGAVSLLVAYHATARVLGKVPASVFWPVPKVDSLIVRLTRRPAAVQVSSQELMGVVRAAFAQRRKMVKNSLEARLEIPAATLDQALARAGIDPEARAESLDLNDFAALAMALR